MVNGSGETISSSSFILTEVKPSALSTHLLFEGERKKGKKNKMQSFPSSIQMPFLQTLETDCNFSQKSLSSGGYILLMKHSDQEIQKEIQIPGGLNPSGRPTSFCHLVCSRMGRSSMLQSAITKGSIHHLKTSFHLDCKK